MRIWSILALGMAFLPATLVLQVMPGAARDYGAAGQSFPIIEPDLLATIEARLRRAQDSGELDRTNALFAKRVADRVRRPVPVRGITPAQVARSWEYDPTIELEKDIFDQKGHLIASAGQKLNPLEFVPVGQALVFIDGDNIEELIWATGRYTDLNAKIIFVNGSPFEQMSVRKRRFYFDQNGKLAGKFGIAHTPAIISQVGKVMRVSEAVLPGGRGG
jgi:conjugal transfer pilus assembly protein TraW